MIELKEYQKETLAVLREYLTQARLRGPADAFAKVTGKHPSDTRQQSYRTRWPGLENVPYVCLRLPTGGGKTLLAAHTVGLATDAFLDRSHPFVLWLCPTDTIRKQTAEALRTREHPCRQALLQSFDGQRLRVFDIADINKIRPQDAFGTTCIVVATMQTLRVGERNKESRKVYGHNENFEQHFARLEAKAKTAAGLDRAADGRPLFSFVNLVHLLQPLVIVDEAHKMISGLSGEVMQRLNPACVVEFTATPVESNVLFRVFPSALKEEEMVKLPFELRVHTSWESAVLGALDARAALDEPAAADADYIRPLALFQAEKRNQDCTVEKLKQFLLDQGIREEEIAIATGAQRELDTVNLFSPDCPVKYVITVEALKEGWDCSFASVFCSVANIRSAIDVEQLLGRVMRMPYAKRRQDERLNRAYAHVMARSFQEAVGDMHSRLLNMGFDGTEAADNIQPHQLWLDGSDGDTWGDNLGRFQQEQATAEPLVLTLEKRPDFSGLSPEETANIKVTAKEGGGIELISTNFVSDQVEERLLAVAGKGQAETVQREVLLHRQRIQAGQPPCPARRGQSFAVPRLLAEVEGFMEPVDRDSFLVAANWSPLNLLKPGEPVLGPEEFRYDPQVRAFLFDLEGEKMSYSPLGATESPPLFATEETKDIHRLLRWLDEQCRTMDISQPDMLEFCRRAVQGLLDAGCEAALLFRGKKILAEVIRNKIAALREASRKQGFQQLLFGPQAKVEVRFDKSWVFPKDGYAGSIRPYAGGYRFQKHYYDRPRDLQSTGEEFRCAQAIDNHPAVEVWLRNVPRQTGSFCLPTSSDNFYPDFLARLKDGRIALIEYKGGNLLSSDDTKEKLNIGKLWEEKSEGRGIFLLVSEAQAQYSLDRQLALQA